MIKAMFCADSVDEHTLKFLKIDTLNNILLIKCLNIFIF